MDKSRPLNTDPSLDSYLQDELVETEAMVCEEFGAKLRLEASDDDDHSEIEKSVEKTLEHDENQRLNHEGEDEDEEHDDDDDDDDDDDEEEFSFSFGGVDTSPIAAEDAFQDGRIRTIFPLFDQSLLLGDGGESPPQRNQLPRRPPVRKVFVESRDHHPQSSSAAETREIDVEPAGPYCAWTKKAVEASPEGCKKSNSTGFSKLWRFRDLLNRSNSDGRDAYVFLNSSTATTSAKREEKVEKSESSSSSMSSERRVAGEARIPTAGGKVKVKKVVKGQTTSSSAHELHYKRNRASKEEDRHRSYLPYRPELVGFFTNVNGGMSRNVHPF